MPVLLWCREWIEHEAESMTMMNLVCSMQLLLFFFSLFLLQSSRLQMVLENWCQFALLPFLLQSMSRDRCSSRLSFGARRWWQKCEPSTSCWEWRCDDQSCLSLSMSSSSSSSSSWGRQKTMSLLTMTITILG